MTVKKTYALSLLAAVLLPSMAQPVHARDMYRYINDQGNVVVGYQVPTQDVHKGYEILNQDGIVMEIIPRELTEEERENISAQEKLAAEAEAEMERVRTPPKSRRQRMLPVPPNCSMRCMSRQSHSCYTILVGFETIGYRVYRLNPAEKFTS